jgi:hypothetical protein
MVLFADACRSGRIFQAEHLLGGVIGEGLGVAGPTHNGPQGLLGGFRRHVVFELVEKLAPGRAEIRGSGKLNPSKPNALSTLSRQYFAARRDKRPRWAV